MRTEGYDRGRRASQETAHESPKAQVLLGERGAQHPLAALIDGQETYGGHVVERFLLQIASVDVAVDLGAGGGRDLLAVKRGFPRATTVAIDASKEYAEALIGVVDRVNVLNLERDKLPFDDGSVDLVIANQVLEHVKEVFWIFHEITRSLKVGGYLIMGVPNVASLHNRILLLFGRQPTQHKLCSAHVRPFSKADTVKFLAECVGDGYGLEKFAGSQFYPFPRVIARPLAKAFPSAAYSIFFLLKKRKPYAGEFLSYPLRAKLETNFWVGCESCG